MVEVYDVRNEKNAIFQVQCQKQVTKIEFNPFNKNEFLILFDKYFVKVNTQTSNQIIYNFDNMKINDFSYNENCVNEFLLCGEEKNKDNKNLGFLDVNKFKLEPKD